MSDTFLDVGAAQTKWAYMDTPNTPKRFAEAIASIVNGTMPVKTTNQARQMEAGDLKDLQSVGIPIENVVKLDDFTFEFELQSREEQKVYMTWDKVERKWSG